MMSRIRVSHAAAVGLTCLGGALACANWIADSDERLAPASALAMHVSVAPDTVALTGDVTLTLKATNPLSIGVRVPGPCPWLSMQLQVLGADSVLYSPLIGGFGCKLPDGPATIRRPPGWTDSMVVRGTARYLSRPDTRPGLFRIRGVYAAPTDTAFGEWVSLWVTP